MEKSPILGRYFKIGRSDDKLRANGLYFQDALIETIKHCYVAYMPTFLNQSVNFCYNMGNNKK